MQGWAQSNAKGIDASHWQGYVRWDKVKAADNSFAFLKATEGAAMTDDTFISNVKGARLNGLLTGAYHFLKTGTASEAEVEATHFLNAVDKADVELPHVLDIEAAGNTLEAALAWLQKVEAATGKRPMVYTYPYFIDNLGDALKGYELWYAWYNAWTPENKGGWDSWTFLQHTDKGRVSGIAGDVDINIYKGTATDLMATYGRPVLRADVANTIITTWVQPSWFNANANGNVGARDYIHWLADELRRAARIIVPPAGWAFTADVANTIIATWIGKDWYTTLSQDQKTYDKWLANELRKASNQPEK